ncbi:MAG: Dabb family protein [Acidimicrobiales bacterium]|nr:Dabb family protein [Acidimicrobiales bacterium]
MIRHIVLLKLNDKGDAESAVAQVRGMDGRIETLRSLEAGVNVVESDRAYDVAVHTTFDDLAGLKVYADHEVHQPVIVWMRAHCSSIVAIDYEF